MRRLILLLIVTVAAGALLMESMPSRPVQATPDAQGIGDVDCNGVVNAIDALLVLQQSARLITSLSCTAAADAYADGYINSLDAYAILAFSAGYFAQLPITPSAEDTVPGTVLALDAETGDILWSVQPGMAALGTPALTDDLLLVQGGNNCQNSFGELVALERATGEERWRMPLETSARCGEADFSALGGVAVVRDDGSALGIDITNGDVLWHRSLARAVDNADGHVLSIATDSLALLREAAVYRAVDRATGTELWTTDLRSYDFGIFASNSTMLFAQDFGAGVDATVACDIAAIDLGTGDEEWRAADANQGCSRPAANEDVVAACIRTSDAPPAEDEFGNPTGNQIVALDADTGDELWRKNFPCTRTQADDVNVYVQRYNVSDRTLAALDPATGEELWHIDSPSAASFLARDGYVFLMPPGEILELDAQSGHVLWTEPVPGPGFGTHAEFNNGVLYVSAQGEPIPSD